MKHSIQHLTLAVFFLLTPFCAQADQSESIVVDEFNIIKVQYHTATMGLIWAYRCETCLPRRLIFDSRLEVTTSQGKVGPEGLRLLNGKGAAIAWQPNTLQALQVWPMLQ